MLLARAWQKFDSRFAKVSKDVIYFCHFGRWGPQFSFRPKDIFDVKMEFLRKKAGNCRKNLANIKANVFSLKRKYLYFYFQSKGRVSVLLISFSQSSCSFFLQKHSKKTQFNGGVSLTDTALGSCGILMEFFFFRRGFFYFFLRLEQSKVKRPSTNSSVSEHCELLHAAHISFFWV